MYIWDGIMPGGGNAQMIWRTCALKKKRKSCDFVLSHAETYCNDPWGYCTHDMDVLGGDVDFRKKNRKIL